MQKTIWIVVSVIFVSVSFAGSARAETYNGTAGNDVIYFGWDYTQARVELCINGVTTLPTIVAGDLTEDLILNGLDGNDTITVAGSLAPSWNPTACGNYRAFECSGTWWILLHGDNGNDKVVGGMHCPTGVNGETGEDEVWVRHEDGYADGGQGSDKVISYLVGGGEEMWGSENIDCMDQRHSSSGPAEVFHCGPGADWYRDVLGTIELSCEKPTWTCNFDF